MRTNSNSGRGGQPRQWQLGVGLVEILITVTILAIGLLGIAALQFLSKRSNFEATERTMASTFAFDIMERMHANPKALQTYAGASDNPSAAFGVDNSGVITIPSEPLPNCKDPNTCSSGQMAAHDRWEWEQLINGAAELSGTSTTGGLALPTVCIYSWVASAATDRSGRHTVAIAWRGPTPMTDPTNPVASSTPDVYACGRDTGALGSGKYDGDLVKNAHRRILLLDSYVRAN